MNPIPNPQDKPTDDETFWQAVRNFFEALATSPRRRIVKLARRTANRLEIKLRE